MLILSFSQLNIFFFFFNKLKRKIKHTLSICTNVPSKHKWSGWTQKKQKQKKTELRSIYKRGLNVRLDSKTFFLGFRLRVDLSVYWLFSRANLSGCSVKKLNLITAYELRQYILQISSLKLVDSFLLIFP